MKSTKIPDEFYLEDRLFRYHSERAVRWELESYKCVPDSEEQQICRLKQRIEDREAMKHLAKSSEILERSK